MHALFPEMEEFVAVVKSGGVSFSVLPEIEEPVAVAKSGGVPFCELPDTVEELVGKTGEDGCGLIAAAETIGCEDSVGRTLP